MSIPFSGTRTRSKGIISSIMKQVKLLNLKPVKKIEIRFDPFYENVKETRDFLHHITVPYVSATNRNCLLKTNIVCDRSEPIVTLNLQSGEKIIIKTAFLTTLNILELFNKHISCLVPPDPAEVEAKEIVRLKKRKYFRQKLRVNEGSKRRGVIL